MRFRTRTSAAVIALGFALLWPGILLAQYEVVPDPAAYALTGVTVVRADGERLTNATVVVRDEFIAAIGRDAAVPADARVLEGDSLFVYPGMIDAWGEAPVELPERDFGRDTIAEWSPPRVVQGFMPSRRLVEYLTATSDDLDDQRQAGIVAAALHPPTDDMPMPGRGVLLLFRKEVEQPRGLVLDPALGPTFSFEDASVYPSTLFGVIAFTRQAFLDAKRRREIEASFADSPARLTRPEWDPDLAVIRDVMDGEPRVFFHANSADDIRRVLGLAAKFGFRPVIVGGREAREVADLLREREVPVLVSLDFPEPERWDPPDDDEEGDEGEAEQADEPLDAAALHEKRRLEDIYANAGRLAEAGVTFALTTGGGEADMREGVRKAIEYGLSREAALRAVTATPAALLGIPSLARVEPGHPATFVVADGPLFAEDTEIAYTFVEGELAKGEAEDAGGGEEPTVDVTGTWDVTFDVGGESVSGTLELEQDGADVTGTASTPEGDARVEDGSVSGNELSFTLVFTEGDAQGTFSGTVEGDEIDGSGSLDFPGGSMSVDWSAERTPQI